jgi:hypothetical protein
MSAPRRSARIAALSAAPAPRRSARIATLRAAPILGAASAPVSTPVKKRSAHLIAPWEIKLRKLAQIPHDEKLEYRIRQLQQIPMNVYPTSHVAREMFLTILEEVGYDICDLIDEIRSERFNIWERKELNIYPEQEEPALQRIDKWSRLIREFVEVATPIRNIVLDETYDPEEYSYLFSNGFELWESILEYVANLDYVLQLEF